MPADECQFVDSNILVYAHDISAGIKRQLAKRLLEDLWGSENGCMSVQVFQEFYATVTTKIKQPLSSDVASQVISSYSVWKVHATNVNDVLDSINIQQRYGISIWDALIVNSASQSGCAILWTEDLNDGQIYEGVRIQNPFKE
jgi:predicted nucleic acid-binding protein